MLWKRGQVGRNLLTSIGSSAACISPTTLAERVAVRVAVHRHVGTGVSVEGVSPSEQSILRGVDTQGAEQIFHTAKSLLFLFFVVIAGISCIVLIVVIAVIIVSCIVVFLCVLLLSSFTCCLLIIAPQCA